MHHMIYVLLHLMVGNDITIIFWNRLDRMIVSSMVVRETITREKIAVKFWAQIIKLHDMRT